MFCLAATVDVRPFLLIRLATKGSKFTAGGGEGVTAMVCLEAADIFSLTHGATTAMGMLFCWCRLLSDKKSGRT